MPPENDRKNYRWIFYYNPHDNRVLVPKTNPSWGFQVNFANPASVVAFLAAIAFFACVTAAILQGK